MLISQTGTIDEFLTKECNVIRENLFEKNSFENIEVIYFKLILGLKLAIMLKWTWWKVFLLKIESKLAWYVVCFRVGDLF